MIDLACFVVAFVGMEGVALVTHKYVMHGALWTLHASHHQPHDGVLEKNDWFVLFFAAPSVLLFHIGSTGVPFASATAAGIAAYGLAYFLFHDVLVHRRIPHRLRPRGAYLTRIVHAHRIHHGTTEKHGAVSFGFLYASPALELRSEMKALAAVPEPAETAPR